MTRFWAIIALLASYPTGWRTSRPAISTTIQKSIELSVSLLPIFLITAAMFMYTMLSITLLIDFAVQSDEEDVEEVDIQMSDDYLFGAVVCNQTLLLFTFKNGFVSVHSNLLDST